MWAIPVGNLVGGAFFRPSGFPAGLSIGQSDALLPLVYLKSYIPGGKAGIEPFLPFGRPSHQIHAVCGVEMGRVRVIVGYPRPQIPLVFTYMHADTPSGQIE